MKNFTVPPNQVSNEDKNNAGNGKNKALTLKVNTRSSISNSSIHVSDYNDNSLSPKQYDFIGNINNPSSRTPQNQNFMSSYTPMSRKLDKLKEKEILELKIDKPSMLKLENVRSQTPGKDKRYILFNYTPRTPIHNSALSMSSDPSVTLTTLIDHAIADAIDPLVLKYKKEIQNIQITDKAKLEFYINRAIELLKPAPKKCCACFFSGKVLPSNEEKETDEIKNIKLRKSEDLRILKAISFIQTDGLKDAGIEAQNHYVTFFKEALINAKPNLAKNTFFAIEKRKEKQINSNRKEYKA